MLASTRTEGRNCSSGMLAVCLWGSCPPAIKGRLCVGAQGRASLARSLRTQPSNPQSERRDACFTAGMEGKEKTKQGKGKEEGKREVLWCYFSLDRGGRTPENYQPFPSYVQTETCQYLSILKSKNA